MIKIQDNFLNKETNRDLLKFVLDSHFTWYFSNGVAAKEDSYYMFTHTFYNTEKKINSQYFNIIKKLFLNKLPIKNLLRIKLNFYAKTKEKIVHGFHTDFEKDHTVALYYLNTNNGQTVFKKNIPGLDSIAGRMVIFDGNLEHSSTTCTDEDFRISLNINYE